MGRSAVALCVANNAPRPDAQRIADLSIAIGSVSLVKVAWMVARTQTGVKVAVLEGDALVSVDGATPVAGPADHPWQVSLVRAGQVIGVSVLPAGQDSADGAVYAP
jgi:hypothetical protein